LVPVPVRGLESGPYVGYGSQYIQASAVLLEVRGVMDQIPQQRGDNNSMRPVPNKGPALLETLPGRSFSSMRSRKIHRASAPVQANTDRGRPFPAIGVGTRKLGMYV